MRFTRDAAFLNTVANHPDVRPHLGTDGKSYIDHTKFLEQDGHFALVNEWGGIIFAPDGEGGFDFHTEFLPEGRGRRALHAALEAERQLFEERGAEVLRTYVPHGNRPALGLIRIIGFSKTHETEEASYWALTKAEWKARASKRPA